MSQADNRASQTEERTLRAEVTIYYDLSLPDERGLVEHTRRPSPLLIALHGYGGSKRQMMREALRLAPEGFAVASLQGFHQHLKEAKGPGGPLRYGFGWLTNFHPEESIALHHRALLDLIDNLVDEKVADPARVFLLGFSQSCALNYRFAFTHTERLRGVIGVCGGLPGDWESSAAYSRTDAAVLHLAGEHDEFYTPERVKDYAGRLLARARDVEVKTYDAAHEIVDAMRERARSWLADHI
jgi:phospholipase/carboxylesterase